MFDDVFDGVEEIPVRKERTAEQTTLEKLVEVGEKFVENYSGRINKQGTNCCVGNIITWSMRKNREQLFGIITEIHPTCVYVNLLNPTFYEHSLSLSSSTRRDNVCFNKLLYTRKLMILRSARVT